MKPDTTVSSEGSYLQQWLLAWIRGEPTPAPPTTRRPSTTGGLSGLSTRLPIPLVPGRQTTPSTTAWPFMGLVPRVPGAGLGVQRGEQSRPGVQSGGSQENYNRGSVSDWDTNYRGSVSKGEQQQGGSVSEGNQQGGGLSRVPGHSKGDQVPLQSNHGSWSLPGSMDKDQSGKVVRGYMNNNLRGSTSLGSQRGFSRKGKQSSGFIAIDDGRRGMSEQRGFISLSNGRGGYTDNRGYGTRRGYRRRGRGGPGFTSLSQSGSQPFSPPRFGREELVLGYKSRSNYPSRGGGGGWTSLREGGG